MTTIRVPNSNWATALARAIKDAPENATISVSTTAKAELGTRAAAPDRLNRPDLQFIVEASPED